MARFLAITARGLIEPLAAELKDLGIKKAIPKPDAVEFESSWADCYRVHLESRIASRVLLPVADFTAYNQEDLYHGVFKRHDFTQYIEPTQTLRVEAHVREHRSLHDQRFVALKVKDALVDQFRKKFDVRPDVGDEERADLRVVIRIVGTNVSLAVDLTGETLSHRGYRKNAGAAPLRETVAAGLLRMSGWDGESPLLDPFCGSGTLLIEAALSRGAGSNLKRRRPFAFERLKNFQADTFRDLAKPKARRAPPPKPFLYGYDNDPRVLEMARANARLAGVENWILFQQRDVRDVQAPAPKGTIITNPPYGERIGDLAQVKKLMSDFSGVLKERFKDWDAWILSGEREASAALRLKSARKIPVWNGPIECRLLHYPLR